MVLDEIMKRGLSQYIKPQANKQQEIHHYKDYSFNPDETGGGSKWFYVITIPIIVIVVALGVNKIFFTEAPKEPTFRLQEYYEAHKNYYGDVPLEYVAKDVFRRGFADEYRDYETWIKATGIGQIIEEDNERRKPSFSDRLKELKVPFPFRFSEESIHGILFRYDRLTRTVELRRRKDKETFTWVPKPEFKNLEHVRDYMAQRERNRQIEAIEEQAETLKRAQIQQQWETDNKNEELKRKLEDIKNTLEAEKRERELQDTRRRHW
jgi:hypothetical protein